MIADQQELSFDAVCSMHRLALKKITEDVRRMMAHSACYEAGHAPDGADRAEMKANIILAYRHLEDAAMRLGKAIQAYDGGVSVYNKTDQGRLK